MGKIYTPNLIFIDKINLLCSKGNGIEGKVSRKVKYEVIVWINGIIHNNNNNNSLIKIITIIDDANRKLDLD